MSFSSVSLNDVSIAISPQSATTEQVACQKYALAADGATKGHSCCTHVALRIPDYCHVTREERDRLLRIAALRHWQRSKELSEDDLPFLVGVLSVESSMRHGHLVAVLQQRQSKTGVVHTLALVEGILASHICGEYFLDSLPDEVSFATTATSADVWIRRVVRPCGGERERAYALAHTWTDLLSSLTNGDEMQEADCAQMLASFEGIPSISNPPQRRQWREESETEGVDILAPGKAYLLPTETSVGSSVPYSFVDHEELEREAVAALCCPWIGEGLAAAREVASVVLTRSNPLLFGHLQISSLKGRIALSLCSIEMATCLQCGDSITFWKRCHRRNALLLASKQARLPRRSITCAEQASVSAHTTSPTAFASADDTRACADCLATLFASPLPFSFFVLHVDPASAPADPVLTSAELWSRRGCELKRESLRIDSLARLDRLVWAIRSAASHVCIAVCDVDTESGWAAPLCAAYNRLHLYAH